MLNVVGVVVGVVLVAAFAALIFPPAGLLVLGVACGAAGLFVDDGS
jgi:hypothetical protein